MITKYDGFILEKLKFEIFSLLEGNIHGTTDFIFKLKSILKKGGRNAAIAEQILNIIESGQWFNDSIIKQNYFDITDIEDKVTFINNKKVLDSGYDEEENPDYPYTIPGRTEVKIGKIVRYLYSLRKLSLSDVDLENFVNIWKSTTEKNDIQFKLVSGDEISKYYDEDKYYGGGGTLGGSCMRDEGGKTFKIYTENPDKVKLLVYVDSDDKVHGRALVWKVKKSPCESKYFMDRVYTNRDSDVNRFKEFADSKDWFYKKKMSAYIEDNVTFIYKGKDIAGEVKLKLKGDFSRYPFIDTMCFLSKDKDSLSNLPDKKCYHLHSVCGERDRCDGCDGDIINTDSNFSSSLCYSCSEGHDKLKSMGIETKWNKKVD